MANREEMMTQIRRALGRANPGKSETSEPPAGLPPARLEDVMPPISAEELLPKFEAELTRVSGVAHRAGSLAELDQILRGIFEASKGGSAVLSRNPLLARLGLSVRLRAMGVSVTEWTAEVESSPDARAAFREACFAAGVGITGVDFALAETGSLAVTSQTEGSQLSSLAPPIHVALYTRQQLVASLDDILERVPLGRDANDAAAGRSVVFITGTSRTADIEQILIRGVHGPKELHAILIESSVLNSSIAA